MLVAILTTVLLAGPKNAVPTLMKKAPPTLDTSYLELHARTRGFSLGRPVKARPTPDGAVVFLRAGPREPKLSLFEFDVRRGEARTLATPDGILKGATESLSPEEKARRERMRVSVGGFTDFSLSADGHSVLASLSGRLHVIERPGGKARELATNPGTLLDPKFSPDGRWVSYVRDHDLFVYDLAKGRERRVTRGGSRDLTHGLAEFVAQEEMGRFSGYWWAPDSRSFLFEEADTSGVQTWWVADPARPGQEPSPQRYPRPGKDNARVRLGLVSIRGGPVRRVSWDDGRYPYVTTVRWDETGPLTVAVQTREQDELCLLRVDPATGATTPLLVERDPAWVPVRNDVPRWLDGGARFVWSREEKNDRVLELRAASGSVEATLHRQAGGHLEVVSVDAARRHVWFRASGDPRQAHVFRLELVPPGGTSGVTPPVRLTDGVGLHQITLARDHSLWCDESSGPESMSVVDVRRPDGETVGRLPSVAVVPPFVPRAEPVDAEGLNAVILRPRDFDAGRRYPVLVDVYGGPGHLKVVQAMAPRLLPQWLADCGFVVVSIDNRGTPGRGRDFERAIRGSIGDVPLEDQAKAMLALCSRYKEMDRERVGIVGWSFGGYLSALAVLRRPELFKAAVAGAPVADWLDYDTHYTERYLGLPEKRRVDYDRASLLTWAKDLSRPLLIVHGTADDNVYFVHSLKLAEALFKAGRPFEILPLPALTHMVPDPVVTQRLWSRIAGFFRTHLGGPE